MIRLPRLRDKKWLGKYWLANPYLLWDRFTTDRAAGSVNGTLSEPGPVGTRSVADTESKLSIAGGKLVFSGGKAVPSWLDPAVTNPSFSRVAGRTMSFSVEPQLAKNWAAGFTKNATTLSIGIKLIAAGNALYYLDNATFGSGTQGTEVYTTAIHNFANILRSTGGFALAKGGNIPNWTLLWVSNTGSDASLVPAVDSYNMVCLVDNVKVFDLPYPWNDDYGIATQRLAGARSAGDAFVHESNCLIGYTVTALSTSGNMSVRWRTQDALNYWDMYISTGGSIGLRECVNGGNTTRGTAAGVVAPGHRIVVICDGQTIKIYVNNALQITYGSAANFATETDGAVFSLGTGGGISDVVSWPRTISGSALYFLSQYAGG